MKTAMKRQSYIKPFIFENFACTTYFTFLTKEKKC